MMKKKFYIHLYMFAFSQPKNPINSMADEIVPENFSSEVSGGKAHTLKTKLSSKSPIKSHQVGF